MSVQAKNNIYWNIRQETGAYTLVAGDVLEYVKMNIIDVNSATDVNLTLPDDSVDIPYAVPFLIRQTGSGKVTLTPGEGVTIQGATLATVNQYDVFRVAKIESNVFILI